MSTEERLVEVIRLLRACLNDIARDPNDDTTCFDIGHLSGAETIIRASIDPKHPALVAYDDDYMKRRLLAAVESATRRNADPPVSDGEKGPR